MDNHNVIERIMRNLSFELEPGPIKQDSSGGDPLSVKIKIKNRQAKVTEREMVLQKVRLVNSDETLMSFYMLMEKDYHQVTPRKPRKNTGKLFSKLKPGLCVKQMDDNDYVYLPSSDHNYNNPDKKNGSKQDGLRKQLLKLSNMDNKDEMDSFVRIVNSKKEKTFLGTKCKAGGCLDPSIDEDRFSYGPYLQVSINQDLKRQPKVNQENSDIDTKSNKINEKESNYKSKEIPFLIKPIDDATFISKKESLQTSLITYPTNDENNKEIKHRSKDDRPSITESINVIFRGFQRNSNNYPRQTSSKNKNDSANDIIQKHNRYLTEKELQYQQQIDSMTVSNLKSGSNINFIYTKAIQPLRTSYSTNDEENINRVEAVNNKQTDMKECKITNDSIPSVYKSVNRLSKESKKYNYSDPKVDNKCLLSIKDIDTPVMNGKTKNENLFLGTKCKPGGCLDPSFDEDTYTYHPSVQALSNQVSEITAVKQENVDVNITRNESSNKIYNESDKISVFIKLLDVNNDKPCKTNEVDSIMSPPYASENAFNMQDTEKVVLKNNHYENNLQHSNNNSLTSFIKHKVSEQDLINYKQQSSCSFVDNKSKKNENSDSSMSLLSTSMSLKLSPSPSINNSIQIPNENLEQESIYKNIEDKEIQRSLIITKPVNLNSNTDLDCTKKSFVNATDTLPTIKTVIVKDTPDLMNHVGSLNTSTEKYSTSSTFDNTINDNNVLGNQIPQNRTLNNDYVELEPTKIINEYNNNMIDLKNTTCISQLRLNIYKIESPKRSLVISDNKSQINGSWQGDDNISFKNNQIIPNKFEQPVNESKSNLFSSFKQFEPKFNVLQTSPKNILESASKTKLTKKSISLLNLSVCSEQNVSITTNHSIYKKLADDSLQRRHTAEIDEHKENSITTSIIEVSPQLLGADRIIKENVSLSIKNIQQDTPEYFLIANTTSLIDEMNGAKNYEEEIDRSEEDQYIKNHLISKTEGEIKDKIQSNSQLLMDQVAINMKSIEYNVKTLPDNEPHIEKEEVKLANNTVTEYVLPKSSNYNKFNENNQTIDDNNKNDTKIHRNQDLQCQNQEQDPCENLIRKDDHINKTGRFIRKADIQVSKSDVVSNRISTINKTNKIEERDCPNDDIVKKTSVKYDDIDKDDLSLFGEVALIHDHLDLNNSRDSPSIAKQKEIVVDLDHNEPNNIERGKLNLVSSKDLSPVKLNNTIILDLTFHSLNEKNQRIIRTIKNENEDERYRNDSTFVLKSKINLSHNQKITIPLGSNVSMTIRVENNSGDVCGKTTSDSISALNQTATKKDKEINFIHNRTYASNEVNSTLTHIYEQDLMPLQMMIRNLKHEIEDLVKQLILVKREVLYRKQPNLQRNQYCNKKLGSKNVNFCTCRST